MSEEDDQKLSSVIELLHHTEGLIALGEQRAGILALGNGALMTAYLSSDRLSQNLTHEPVHLGFGLLAIILAFWALWPQTESTSWFKANSLDKFGVYFGTIGAVKPPDFSIFLNGATTEQLAEDIAKATCNRARKAKFKFSLLAFSVFFSGLQIVSLVTDYMRTAA